MKKRILVFILLCALVANLTGIQSFASSWNIGEEKHIENILYVMLEDGTLGVKKLGYYKSQKQYKIPGTVKGYAVTTIMEGAFFDINNGENVTIPEGVYRLEEGAVDNCALGTLSLPSTLTDINSYNFYPFVKKIAVSKKNPVLAVKSDCLYNKENGKLLCYPVYSNHKNVVIPDEITELDYIIACPGLEKITLSANLKKINAYISSEGKKPLTIVIPKGMDTLPPGILPDHSTEPKVETGEKPLLITVEKGNETYAEENGALIDKATTTVLYYASAKANKSVTLPEGITAIGYRAFYNNTDMESIILPESLTGIKEEAFAQCSSLQTVEMPDSVREIGDSAFTGCNALKTITLPASMTTIGTAAFENSGIETINLPESMETIREAVFRSCKSLKSISIPSSIARIEGHAFEDSGIESISLPESIQTISDSVFKSCESLKSIELPSSVTQIDNSAFEGSGIKDINLSDSVSTLGENAFKNCKDLKSINIPSSINQISSSTFENSGLESIVLPETIQEIGPRAFKDCKALKSIDIPESVSIIGDEAFSISGIGSIILPDSVRELGEGVFRRCNQLKSITIPSLITTISESAFESSGIESIILPDTITEIGKAAFKNCKALKAITLPSSVIKIGSSAFEGSTIESIILPDSVKEINNRAFRNCEALQSIQIPASVTSIGKDLFRNKASEAPITIITDSDSYAYAYLKTESDNGSINAIFKDATGNEIQATITETPPSVPETAPEPQENKQWTCPSCGKILTSKFCPDCGTTRPEEATDGESHLPQPINDNSIDELVTLAKSIASLIAYAADEPIAGEYEYVKLNGKMIKVHAEFKYAMDVYYEFYAKYLEAVKKADFITQMAMVEQAEEVDAALEKINNMDLTDGDMAYYLDVYSKILEITLF